jgi:predicted ribosomally synthesized peptide with SipW-like signal peptide
MFSVIRSFLVILTVAVVATGSTYSFFSATDTIADNTITTATVTFSVEGEANETTLAKPISATNLFPGSYTQWARAALQNDSLFPLRYYMYVTNPVGDACDEVNLTVATGIEGSDASERTANIYLGNLLDLVGEENRELVSNVPPFDPAPAGSTQIIQQRAQLDSDAGNDTQNQSCTWDEVFVAESVAPAL